MRCRPIDVDEPPLEVLQNRRRVRRRGDEDPRITVDEALPEKSGNGREETFDRFRRIARRGDGRERARSYPWAKDSTATVTE